MASHSSDLSKRSRLQQGHEVVRSELEVMNRSYMQLLAQLHHRLKLLKDLHDREGLFFPVSRRTDVTSHQTNIFNLIKFVIYV